MLGAARPSLPLTQLTVPVLLGPTGVGKSEAAFRIARELGAEIVVCDSRQVYDRLDIATNKPSPDNLRRVPHHLVGVADPRDVFSVKDFVELAGARIAEVAGRSRVPIIEGGSMLWADALTDGFSLSGVPPDPALRRRLDGMPLEKLDALLRRLDPEATVDRRNPVRLIRAIEVLEAVGPPLARTRTRTPPVWRPLRLGLTASLATIDARLAERSRRQLERGLVEETRAALEAGVPPQAPVLTGIGYAQAVAHLQGELPEAELEPAMNLANRRYARRQLRWLRRDTRIRWFMAESDPVPGILAYLRETLI